MSLSFTPAEVWTYFAPYVANRERTRGSEYRGPCPVHKGKNNNFLVDVETGLCFCFSKCGRGWDLIGLDQELFGGDFKAALKRVLAAVGRQCDELSAAELARLADQRKKDQIDEAMAVCWHRGLIKHLEEELVCNKRSLFRRYQHKAAAILVRSQSERLRQLSTFNRSELVADFRLERERNPARVAHWVRIGAEDLEDCRMVCVAIVRLIEMSVSQFPALGVEKLGGSKE